MGSKAIDIPAGATDYAITDTYVLPSDVTVLSVYPHAHYLGKDMQVRATLPNGSQRTLLRITRWNFHWQQDYRFTTPIALPRGTSIAMRFTYDNSDANPENPRHPPVRVMAGPRSIDEMGNLLLQLVPASAADRTRLQSDATAREAAANVAAAELMARTGPNSAENLTFLGASYVDVGRLDEGIAALTKAIALNPDSGNAHNELAGGLLKAGRAPEAVREFRLAARFSPSDPYVHFNLAKALMAANAPDAAKAALVRALALNPDFPEAHDELGVWLFARGRVTEAIEHLRRAAALAPDSAIAHSDLGGALAQAGKRDEALGHLRRALSIDPGNAAARENLARLERRR
jgi:Flp pilus assembly protein TadD